MESIKIHDKSFVPFILKDDIDNRIAGIASELENKFKNKQPVFLIVLNGASFFGVDLLKKYRQPCSIQFLRLKSYEGLFLQNCTLNISDTLTFVKYIS